MISWDHAKLGNDRLAHHMPMHSTCKYYFSRTKMVCEPNAKPQVIVQFPESPTWPGSKTTQSIGFLIHID